MNRSDGVRCSYTPEWSSGQRAIAGLAVITAGLYFVYTAV